MRVNHRVHRVGFTLVELLVVIAIIGALVALLLPAVQAAREAARKSTCINQLKQQGLALLNYHDTRKRFPLGLADEVDDGVGTNYSNDGYGWALAILPYLEQQTLYDLVNPDWEPGIFRRMRDANLRIPGADTAVDVFRCPSSELPPFAGSGNSYSEGYGTNDYKASNGDGFSGMFYRAADGAFVDSTRVRIADVTDGLSNTIALGESAYYGALNDWPIWIGAPNTDEPVLFKTVQPSDINCKMPVKVIENFPKATRRGGPVDDDCAFSWHNGGAHFAFADGSVHWLQETMDFQIYIYLGVKNDGQVTSNVFQ